MYIKRVKVKNFRTLLDFEMEFNPKFQIIAGANNSGKSNLLRALNLFFNEKIDNNDYYDRDIDLSYHIAKGTGSTTTPPEIEVDLFLENDEIKKITRLSDFVHSNILRTKMYYDSDWEGWYHCNSDGEYPSKTELTMGSPNEITTKSHPISRLFERVRFIYIPSQFDVSKEVNQLVADEILPLMVDSYGDIGLSKKIKELKEKLLEVDSLTKEILEAKNEYITEHFRSTILKFPEIQSGIDIKDFKLEVSLKDDSLAKVLSGRIELNVKDASHSSIESKGSGIQKLVLIALLKYFSETLEAKARYTNPFLIWAIDEPESFMHPKLQKEIRQTLKSVSETHQIIITTHSPNMVDIFEPTNVKLFYLTSEILDSKRAKKILFKKNTKIISETDPDFINLLKSHFGIETNDGWLVGNQNIIFEGSDDPIYFCSTYRLFTDKNVNAHLHVCSGSANMPAFVELLKRQAKNKIKLICLLDNDDAGNEAAKKLSKKDTKICMTNSLYLSTQDNTNPNYPTMIEDMVIPEVFYEAVCVCIKDRIDNVDLTRLTFADFKTFREKSKRTPMMEVVDNFFSDLRLKFSFSNLDIKYAIAINYNSIIEKLTEADKNKYKIAYAQLGTLLKNFDN